MSKADFAGQLVGADVIRTYVFGGHARFTVVSKKTGTRYTYRVQLPKENEKYGKPDPERGPFFVKVLTGDDNESSYTFLGTVRKSEAGFGYAHSAKSHIRSDAPSATAFAWFLRNLGSDAVEVFHDGTCCRCGRALTVPESVASGIGPVCAGRE